MKLLKHLIRLLVCRLDSLDIPPAIFHDVSPHSFYGLSLSSPGKVNDFNLVTLRTLDKLRTNSGSGAEGRNATISTNRASASFSEKEYSYQHQRG